MVTYIIRDAWKIYLQNSCNLEKKTTYQNLSVRLAHEMHEKDVNGAVGQRLLHSPITLISLNQ